MATRATRGSATHAQATTTTPLERELEQAKAGTHARLVAEEKRLAQVKVHRIEDANKLRKYRLSMIDAQFDAEKRVAEEAFAREKGIVQNRLIEEVIDRQKRHSKVQQQPRVIGGSTSAHRRAPCPQVDKSEQSAVTRKMRQLRGEARSCPAAPHRKIASRFPHRGPPNDRCGTPHPLAGYLSPPQKKKLVRTARIAPRRPPHAPGCRWRPPSSRRARATPRRR